VNDRRITTTRDGKPVWIRPRRGCREAEPAARRTLYRTAVAVVTTVLLAGCSHSVGGTGVRGPKFGDQAYFFAGDVALYGQSVSADDVAYLAYLRALRRVDVCGLLTDDALAKVGEIVSYGTFFDFDDCDAQLKVSGSGAPRLVSAELQMSRTLGKPPAFEVGHTGVVAGESCSWLMPVPLSRMPGAPPLPTSAQPIVILSEVGGDDCDFTKPIATALATRLDSGTLPPRDAAASYLVRLAERDPCEVVSALAGQVADWKVRDSQAYHCQFTMRDTVLDVGLRPQIVGTQGVQRIDAAGTEAYLDPASCSAVAFVDAPMQHRLADGRYVDVADTVARPSVTVDDVAGHDCDAAADVVVQAAMLYG